MPDQFEKGKHFINKKNAQKNLKEVYNVFNKHNIPLIMIFGTLLGAIREKNFLDCDNDIDLAAFWTDRDRILEVVKKELSSFTVQDIQYPHDINLIRDNEKIELWLFEDCNTHYIYDPKRCGNIKYNKEFFDKAIKHNFLGINATVPLDPKRFLEVTYGPTWVTPNPNGSYILK